MTQTDVECALSKIRIKNLGYNEEHEATAKGERIALDISSIINTQAMMEHNFGYWSKMNSLSSFGAFCCLEKWNIRNSDPIPYSI
jgi:hypothetical protein